METGETETISAPAILTTTESHFRVLLITDLHSDAEERLNEKTRDMVRTFVAHFEPHLVAGLGDLWCGDSHPEAAAMWMRRDLDFLGGLGCPWGLALGNHDWCGDFESFWNTVARTPNAVAPVGDGAGSFRIELRSGSGEPAWDLFFLNSGDAWEVPRRTEWFEAEMTLLRHKRGREVPALCCFHIPTGNYQAVIDGAKTQGVGNESVLGWGDDDGAVADILTRLGLVRACFCGHSHRNDFHFVDRGTLFAYARPTGFGGYGGEDLSKGATELELDMDSGDFRFRSVFLQDEMWCANDWTDSTRLFSE